MIFVTASLSEAPHRRRKSLGHGVAGPKVQRWSMMEECLKSQEKYMQSIHNIQYHNIYIYISCLQRNVNIYIYIYLSTLSICMEERFNISYIYIYIHNDKQIYSPNLPNGKKHGFSQVNCFARCITPHLVFWQSLSPRGIYLENLLGRHPISGTPNPSLGYVFEGETCSLNLQIIKEGLDSLSDNFS